MNNKYSKVEAKIKKLEETKLGESLVKILGVDKTMALLKRLSKKKAKGGLVKKK